MLHLGNVGRYADHHARTHHGVSARTANEKLDHFLGNVIAIDHTVPQRADHLNIIRISSKHNLRIFADPRDTVGIFIDRDNGRIFVTHRELLGTWEENSEQFAPSQTVSGIVRSIEDYGIFVELTPNLAGLAELKSGVRVGDVASVYIKSIMPERMKVKLVIIDSSEGELPKKKRYFIDAAKVKHISSWRYSPKESNRIIETVF